MEFGGRSWASPPCLKPTPMTVPLGKSHPGQRHLARTQSPSGQPTLRTTHCPLPAPPPPTTNCETPRLGSTSCTPERCAPSWPRWAVSPPPRNQSSEATTCRGTRTCRTARRELLVFTPAKVARRKLSRARVAPYLGCGWQWPRTRMIVGSNRRQQPRPSQIEPAQEHPPARPELLTSATHPPAVRAQPGVGSARPADWGGDSRVCPPFHLAWCTPGLQARYFSSDKKLNIFLLLFVF